MMLSPISRWIGWAFLAMSLGILAGVLWHFLPRQPRSKLAGQLTVVWLSPDGCKLLTLDTAFVWTKGPLRLWDTRTGEELHGFLGDAIKTYNPLVTPDGRYLVACVGPGELRFVEWQTRREWAVHLEGITNLSFHMLLIAGSGTVLAVRDEKGKAIVVLETASGRVLDRLESNQLEWSAAGDYLFYANREKQPDGKEIFTVSLWNTRSRRRVGELKMKGWELHPSPDGKTLVIRDFQPGNPMGDQLLLLDMQTRQPRAHIGRGVFTRFSNDSKVLATSTFKDDDCWLEFWEVDTGRRISAGPGKRPPPFACFSPDKSLFVGGYSKENWTPAYTVHDVATGKVLWTRSWLADFHLPAGFPQFSANGKTIVANPGAPTPTELLDATTGKTKMVLNTDHPVGKKASGYAFVSPDGRWLAYHYSVEGIGRDVNWFDNVLEVFGATRPGDVNIDEVGVQDTNSLQKIAVLQNPEAKAVYLSNDGQTLITKHDNYLACWDLPPGPSIWLVLGIPGGLGCMILLWKWKGYRRRMAAGNISR